MNKIEDDRSWLRHLLELALSRLSGTEADVSFGAAVQTMLVSKACLRARTLAEIRGVCRRLMKMEPSLEQQRIQGISRLYCLHLIELCGSTPRQQAKIRLILHGVFEYCRRQEWCVVNPVSLLPAPRLKEGEISPLTWDELVRLMKTARLPAHCACLPALGVMLWAGVRPAELCRLRWEDIDFEENVITLHPEHSKTGGCRHIRMHAVLRRCLLHSGLGKGSVCPPDWQRRWRRLRDAAGIIPWRQDVLRHTFASYHAKQFHDFAQLQIDMGHRSAELLRTRYLSMRGITAAHAALFWKPGAL